tara:strand:+ start:1774 stop:2106 length:333 start_codon:yes stop_codon:yes gene_type:complete
MKNNLKLFLIFSLYIVLTTAYIIHKHKYKNIKALIADPFFIISLSMIILWIIYIYYFNGYGLINNEKLYNIKTATFHGMIAFIIALFAHIDVTIPVFWLILLISYHIGFI